MTRPGERRAADTEGEFTAPYPGCVRADSVRRYQRGMTSTPTPGGSSRSAAVGDLFAALEGLMISYQALPDPERERRWGTEAELITGAVALHLSTARAQIAARSRPGPGAAVRPPELPPPGRAEGGPGGEQPG